MTNPSYDNRTIPAEEHIASIGFDRINFSNYFNDVMVRILVLIKNHNLFIFVYFQ